MVTILFDIVVAVQHGMLDDYLLTEYTSFKSDCCTAV
jgi:hypothetical protein